MADVNGTALTWTSPLSLTVSPITAGNVSYYVYLYDSGSAVAAIERSTTEPVWDATLNAWKKTGDATKRCVGFFMSNLSSAVIAPFLMVPVKATERLRKLIYYKQGALAGIDIAPVLSALNTWEAFTPSGGIAANAVSAVIQGSLFNAAASGSSQMSLNVLGLDPSSLPSLGMGEFLAYGDVAANAIQPVYTFEVSMPTPKTLYFGSYTSGLSADYVGSAGVTGLVLEI